MNRLLIVLSLLFACQTMNAKSTHVGVAKVDVTPKHRVLLAGYGGRRTESEGVDTRIWARALAIGKDDPLLLIVVDNCGVPESLVEKVAERLKSQIKRERLVISSTHTHSAPTLRGYAPIVWAGRATAEQEKRVDQYSSYLVDKLVEVAMSALKSRQEATLSWGRGRVTFGGNRRVLSQQKWRGFGHQQSGPVDHSLPILVAKNAKGKPFAIWTNYACHCTTAGSRNRIGGDWVGFANEAIEKNHPGVMALTSIGCGADVGPQPSGSLRLAQQHGQSLAKEVKRLLTTKLQSLTAAPSAKMRRLKLPFAKIPKVDHWQKQAKGNGFHAEHARLMLATLKRKGKLPTHLDYPVTTWTFGDQLAMVFLPGEVVVDYSVRLNRELDWTRLWITAWSNDVPCYIPSRRVLAEGGYEADFSMIYYARPTRFAANVEEVLVSGVKDLLGKSFKRRSGQELAPFHRPPSGKELVQRRLREWVQSNKNAPILRRLKETVSEAQNGFKKVIHNDGGTDRWYDSTGLQSVRPFIRQSKRETTIRWQVPSVEIAPKSNRVVLMFLAGVGWESQPKTEGFALLLNDREILTFDVTRSAREWKKEKISLLYLPTWSSNEDSAGLFLLSVPTKLIQKKSITLGARSLGSGSKRWFALEQRQDLSDLKKTIQSLLNQ